MQQAGVSVNWIDNSAVSASSTATQTSPEVRFFALITSDKGKEDLTELSGQDWYDMYGSKTSLSYEKHGQPLIQAAEIIESGGILVTKRLVAEDATLANAVVVATVTKDTRDKKDASGNQLYIDADGVTETTTVTSTKATYDVAVITHSLKTIKDCLTFEDVVSEATLLMDKSKGIYPLFAIADNGRGKSIKSAKFTANYAISKGLSWMQYGIKSLESTTLVESANFAINSSIVGSDGKSKALTKSTLTQLDAVLIDSSVSDYISALAAINGLGEDYMKLNDFIAGKTVKGSSFTNTELSDTSADIYAEYGFSLDSGSNGEFGDLPLKSASYTTTAVKYLGGEVSDEIYDPTAMHIDLMFGANYPAAVYRKMEELVEFREDFFLFEDLGLGLTTYDAIEAASTDLTISKSRYMAMYCTNYQVVDPVTKKPIKVSMLYGMAPLMVAFYKGGRHRPLAGSANGMSITNYIPGTVEFVPKTTPKVKQKEQLGDIRVNYACKTDATIERLDIETLYTSQDGTITQCSYINNVLTVQMVIAAVKAYSSKIRYSWTTSKDFADYADMIEKQVLSNYTSFFTKLSMSYDDNDEDIQLKQFRAQIICQMANFFQSEVYDVYIINSNS